MTVYPPEPPDGRDGPDPLLDSGLAAN